MMRRLLMDTVVFRFRYMYEIGRYTSSVEVFELVHDGRDEFFEQRPRVLVR